MVNEIYESFVGIVAEGRNLSLEKVHKLADGSVYTGRQALALGMIDALGYEEDAIAKAAELGGITGTPRVILLSPPTISLLSALTGRMNQSILPENFLTDLLAPKLEYRWTGQ